MQGFERKISGIQPKSRLAFALAARATSSAVRPFTSAIFAAM